MLLGVGRRLHNIASSRDSIHNYYERAVLEQLLRSSERAQIDPEFLADTACVALNRLPPRYVRYDVDMTFFLSPMEMEEMTNKVAAAVNWAVDYVTRREEEKARTEEEPEIPNESDATEPSAPST